MNFNYLNLLKFIKTLKNCFLKLFLNNINLEMFVLKNSLNHQTKFNKNHLKSIIKF